MKMVSKLSVSFEILPWLLLSAVLLPLQVAGVPNMGLKVKINQITIPRGMTDLGEKCDDDAQCDPMFKICTDNNNCVTTGKEINKNLGYFDVKIGDTPNPIYVKVDTFSDATPITISVFDWNEAGNKLISEIKFEVDTQTLYDEGTPFNFNKGINGKTMVRGVITFSCAEGETDPKCSPCARNNPCRNRAKCIPEGSSYRCECLEGYLGTNCENTVEHCDSQFRQNCKNGRCELSHGRPKCVCDKFYRGPSCEQQLKKSGIQMTFLKFENQDGVLKSGQKCDGGKSPCDPFYKVCIDYDERRKKCSVDEEQTTDWSQDRKKRSYSPYGTVGDVTRNPLFFPVTSLEADTVYPVNFTVFDHNTGATDEVMAQVKDSFKGSDLSNKQTKVLKFIGKTAFSVELSFLCDPNTNAYPCEHKARDPCTGVYCFHDGTCRDGKCVCPAPWTGDDCSQKIKDPCQPNPCKNGGACRKNEGSYTCTCRTNYVGTNCETNPCDTFKCENGGQCRVQGQSAVCRCPSLYEGAHCETKKTVSGCDPSYCNNHGTCSILDGQKKCKCQDYAGDRCDEKTGCSDKPCKNGGECTFDDWFPDEYQCKCPPGTSGTHCENGGKKCKPDLCKNGGTCEEDPANKSYKCKCADGYEGTNCETKTKYCTAADLCKNGGTCEEDHPNKSYKCKCADGYEGTNCETKTKYCTAADLCKNGGTCEENHPDRTYKCKCPSNFVGKQCENKKLFCSDDSCGEHGTCEEKPALLSFSCVCNPGYTGKLCKETVKYCKENSCNNHGECIENHPQRTFKCKCDQQYEGETCATKKTNCKTDTCNGHGTCLEDEPEEGAVICMCYKGYDGVRCEKKTYCNENACQNNGACVEVPEKETFKCNCKLGFVGDRCEKKNPCVPKPCANGKCIPDNVAMTFHCKCPKGYQGKLCDEAITTVPPVTKLPEVGGEHCLFVRLMSYNNELSKRIDGDYCDGHPFLRRKQTECDTFFKVCAKNSKEKCITTDPVEDKDVVDKYGPQIGKTDNPLIFHMIKLEESTNIAVTATDDDKYTNDDLIDKYSSDRNTRLLMEDERSITFSHEVGNLLTKARISCCDQSKGGRNCDQEATNKGDMCLILQPIIYSNPKGLLAVGSPCKPISKKGTCDPIFTFCVNEKCTLKYKYVDDKEINFGDKIGLDHLPLEIKINRNLMKVNVEVSVIQLNMINGKSDILKGTVTADFRLKIPEHTGVVENEYSSLKLKLARRLCSEPSTPE